MNELLPILIAYSVIVTLWAVSERIGRNGLEANVATFLLRLNHKIDVLEELTKSHDKRIAKRGQL